MSRSPYTPLRRLGAGGMAEVLLAENARGERVVLKRILPHLANDEALIDMFLDEARVASQLKHKNICEVLDMGTQEGTYFLALEKLDGVDLESALQHHPTFSLQSAIFVVKSVAAALVYAHEARDSDDNLLGVVHRDVSPSNIFLCHEGVVKLIDFGIAKSLDRLTHTMPGAIKGKLRYLAPEQCTGGDVDGRSDLFALALVFFEMLIGKPELGNSLVERFQNMSKGKLNHAVEDTGFPVSLKDFFKKAFAFNKNERFDDARDFERALRKLEQEFASPLSSLDAASLFRTLSPQESTRVSAIPETALGTVEGTEEAGFDSANASGFESIPDTLFVSEASTILRPRVESVPTTNEGFDTLTTREATKIPEAFEHTPRSNSQAVPRWTVLASALAIVLLLFLIAALLVQPSTSDDKPSENENPSLVAQGQGAASRIQNTAISDDEREALAREKKALQEKRAALIERERKQEMKELALAKAAQKILDAEKRAKAKVPLKKSASATKKPLKKTKPISKKKEENVNFVCGGAICTRELVGVWWGQKKLGTQPLSHRIPVGKHVFYFRAESGEEARVVYRVVAGRDNKVSTKIND